ncbi:hypothetical protein [Streptomyces griseoluteus]
MHLTAPQDDRLLTVARVVSEDAANNTLSDTGNATGAGTLALGWSTRKGA